MAVGVTQSGSGAYEERWRAHLEGVRSRDPKALERLYDDTSRLLFSLALRILTDRQDAEEVILDVYQQVWNAAQRYDPTRGSVLSWLSVMTRNRAIDRVRQSNLRRSRELSIEEPVETADEAPQPERKSILEQERKLVRQAMASLGKQQR